MSRLQALVCEGVCNPLLSQLDHAVDQIRRTGMAKRDDARLPLENGEVLDALRRQKHTIHKEVGNGRWACQTCGHERKYGGA